MFISLLCVQVVGLGCRKATAGTETSTRTYSSERCLGCHGRLADEKTSNGIHPQKMLNHHPLTKFTCIDCHLPAVGHSPTDSPSTCPIVAGPFFDRRMVQTSCSKCHENTYALSGANLLIEGEHLFKTRGCIACHPLETSEDKVDHPAAASVDRKFAPPLNGIREKLKDRRWLRVWLMGPRRIRPGTMMPDFGLAASEASEIGAFLLSLSDSHEYSTLDLSGSSADRGKDLFTHRGCRACHVVNINEGVETRRIPSLNDAGTKLRSEWVLLELEHPRAYNPDARIPLIDATQEEVFDIIAYLDTLTLDSADLTATDASYAASDRPRGQDRARHYGCYACHRIDGFAGVTPPGGRLGHSWSGGGQNAGTTQRLRDFLGQKSPPSNQFEGNGTRGRMPVFHLSKGERSALVTFLMRAPANRSSGRFVPERSEQRIGQVGEDLLYDYGCRNCHRIQSGSSPRVTRLIDRTHLIPPRLVDEGRRVQPQWLVTYLKKPFRMRIWLGMGMPHFYLADSEAKGLVRLFRMRSGFDSASQLIYRLPFDVRQVDSEERALGRYRFQHDRCVQCHPADLHPDLNKGLPAGVSLDDLAIDLMLTKNRLRYEWVREFLRNPDRFAGADTRMPFIYFSPDGVPKVPDATVWLQRVARFLYIMDALPEDSPSMTNQREVIDVNKFWEDY